MTPNEVAQQSFQFWTGVIPGVIRPYGKLQAYAWLAMQDGETSFRWPFPVGDHGHAHGGFQHQLPRILAIQKGTGINLLDPNLTNLDCLKATDWETSEHGPSPYKVIRKQLEATTALIEAVSLLVHKFEQSAHQERDTAKRFQMARNWQVVFP